MSDPEVRLAEALVEELPGSCDVDRDLLKDWLVDALPSAVWAVRFDVARMLDDLT